MGNDGPKQTPQVFPFLRRMNPLSPQLELQEFLMIHDSSFDPTMKTAWLSFSAQLSKIPDE